MIPAQPFAPHRLVRTATAQTMLAMVRPRGVDITLDEQPVLLDAGSDYTGLAADGRVRLLGYYNPSRRPGVNLGLVMVLHGWEGCSHSNFPLLIAQALADAGYAVFRLNLRDHGPGLHVDPYALNRACSWASLSMRSSRPPSRLRCWPKRSRSTSLAPPWVAILPCAWLRAIPTSLSTPPEGGRCLPCAQPAACDRCAGPPPGDPALFSAALAAVAARQAKPLPGVIRFRRLGGDPAGAGHDRMVCQHYPQLSHHQFPDADSYLRAYAVKAAELADLQVRTTIITSKNDPVIPVVDFYRFAAAPALGSADSPDGRACRLHRPSGAPHCRDSYWRNWRA